MARGYPTEKAIEDQVIALGETSMTQQEIAEMVGISRRQVGRIWRRVGVRQKGARSPVAVPQAGLKQVSGDVEVHHIRLLTVLEDLEGAEVFHPATQMTMYQLLSQEHGSWSIDKGQLRKGDDGSLSIELWAENQVEWVYLQEHLDRNPLWELLPVWKSNFIRDIESRLDLMGILKRRVEAPVKDGGVGIRIVAADPGSRRPGYLYPYYLNFLYRQVSLNARGTDCPLKRCEEFITDEAGRVWLEGHFVMAPKSRGQKDRAVEFFVRSQADLVGLREARSTAEAYQEALKRTKELRREVRKILLSPGLAGSCELCCPYLS